MKHKLNLCILCQADLKEAYDLKPVPSESTFYDKCDKCKKKRAITPYIIEVKRHRKV